MGKTVAIIPSRFDSSRLPGKALRPLCGEPMLGRLLDRIAKASALDEIVVATTDLPADDAIVDLARKKGVRFFRGSPTDVLGRITGAINDARADVVVEIMGDSPLVDGELVEDTLATFHDGGFDFASSYTQTVVLKEHSSSLAQFPVGIWVEVFGADVMRRCERERTDAFAREHSTSSIYRHPDLFRLGYLEAKGKWASCHRPDLFLAVNEQHQFDLVHGVFELCLPTKPLFSVHDAIAACDRVPQPKAPS